VIDDPHAATQRGPGIGDPLAAAQGAFPELHCQEADEPGGEYTPDPAFCTGRIAKERFTWFGNDPIRIIALSKTRMG
jgi:hypothetical protein